jgi:dephospho-CoA kinase
MTPFRLGLTGSIGMGKSTTAAMFADLAVPVWDADQAVHRLYARGGAAVGPLAAVNPAVICDGAVSRPAMKAWIAADPAALARIESVVHPMVAADRLSFIASSDEDLVVLDIPLLFETAAEARLDATLLVTAPAALQKARVLSRPGMTEELFLELLNRQMPDRDKRARATHIIETLSLSSVRAGVQALVAYIRETKDA